MHGPTHTAGVLYDMPHTDIQHTPHVTSLPHRAPCDAPSTHSCAHRSHRLLRLGTRRHLHSEHRIGERRPSRHIEASIDPRQCICPTRKNLFYIAVFSKKYIHVPTCQHSHRKNNTYNAHTCTLRIVICLKNAHNRPRPDLITVHFLTSICFVHKLDSCLHPPCKHAPSTREIPAGILP